MSDLQDVKAATEGKTVTALRYAGNSYPYIFVGEEYLGWACEDSYSNLNPFTALGFTVENVHIDLKQDSPLCWSDVDVKFAGFTMGDLSLTDTIKRLLALNSELEISENL